jgi:hypothetical protein
LKVCLIEGSSYGYRAGEFARRAQGAHRATSRGRRAVDVEAYLAEAARRYAEDLELEGELAAVAEAGIADAEAGRYTTIATCEDGEAWLGRSVTGLLVSIPSECDTQKYRWASSSAGQSTRLISVGSEVQILPGPPLMGAERVVRSASGSEPVGEPGADFAEGGQVLASAL